MLEEEEIGPTDLLPKSEAVGAGGVGGSKHQHCLLQCLVHGCRALHLEVNCSWTECQLIQKHGDYLKHDCCFLDTQKKNKVLYTNVIKLMSGHRQC